MKMSACGHCLPLYKPLAVTMRQMMDQVSKEMQPLGLKGSVWSAGSLGVAKNWKQFARV